MANRQATEQINVRFTQADLEALEMIHNDTGERVSEILRRVVREEAARLQATRAITLSTRL